MAGIVIVDYGMANLRSVQKAFERVGHAADDHRRPGPRRGRPTRWCCPASAPSATPSPGCARPAWPSRSSTHIRAGKPFLGICLGLQLLFTRELRGRRARRAWTVPRRGGALPDVPGLKVPHMGWNTLRVPAADCPLFAGLPADPAVYFVHSYYAVPARPRRSSRPRRTTRRRSPRPSGGTTCSRRSSTRRRARRVGLTMLKNSHGL